MLKLTNNPDLDYYEQSKFNLTWYLIWGLAFLFCILCVTFSFIQPKFVIHYGLGLLAAIFSLYMMVKTRSYRFSAKFLSTVGFLLNASSFFVIGDAPHLIESFWLLNISVYAYFTVGKRWGNTFFVGTILVAGYYVSFDFQKNLVLLGENDNFKFVVMALELMITLIVFAIIINTIVRSHNYATQQYTESNNQLLFEKDIVDSQNKEKTVLLQEIHHRVKNNLQVIVSLLRLQSSKIRSATAKDKFQQSINRIMTMALIHQKMYEGDSLSKIDLVDYFDSLIDDLIASNTSGAKIDKCIDIHLEKVGNKSIIPLALLINELVTNSIKHAFEGKKSGLISVMISEINESTFKLIYSDNGDWKEPIAEGSMGLELIEAFTEQLEGSYTFEVKNNHSTYIFNLSIIDQI